MYSIFPEKDSFDLNNTQLCLCEFQFIDNHRQLKTITRTTLIIKLQRKEQQILKSMHLPF